MESLHKIVNIEIQMPPLRDENTELKKKIGARNVSRTWKIIELLLYPVSLPL
jgi:hypothetical protein